MGYAVMAAGYHWCLHRYSIGVFDWLHSQSVVRVGHMGLQRAPGQCAWTDMSAVFCALDAGGVDCNRTR